MTQQIPLSNLLSSPLVPPHQQILNPSNPPHQGREEFSNYFTYVLSSIGFAAGYGSFWRFPSLVYKHGGGAFLVPYLIVMVFLGVPLLYLETAVGQMHHTTIPRIFERVNKGLKMFGYVVIFTALGISIYYNTLLTYSYRFIFVCFQSPLPFLNQPSTSNEYFKNHILHKSASIDEFGTVHWELAVLFLLSVFICYLIIKQGLEIGGKILIVTVIGPYVFLVILALRAIPLEGSMEGIKYLFTPDFSKIFTGEIWVDATVQVFFQFSIASAGLINFASLKRKTESFTSILYLIPLSLILCGFLCGCVIFMYVGHFCQTENLLISQLTLSGPELAFSVVPKAIASLPWPNLWLLIFSVILVFLGIDTEFGFMEAVAGAIQQDLKERGNKLFGYKVQTRHVYLLLTIIIGMSFPLFCSSAGIYYLTFFDSFISEIGLPLGAFIELYIFVYLFEFDKLEDQVFNHLGEKAPSYIRWTLKSKVIIGALGFVLALGVLHQLLLYRSYSLGKYVMGWVLSMYPITIALIYWRMYRTPEFRLTFGEIEEYEKNQPLPVEMM